MASNDWKDGYREGYQDGLKDGKKSQDINKNNPITIPYPYEPNKPIGNTAPITYVHAYRCPECGLDFSKPMGYVCPNMKCPTQPRVGL